MTPPSERSPRAAVALAYREGDVAPRVVAQGRGLVAETIIERARASGVFVHESRELVTLLMQVDLDSHIPPTLYVAVAELLAWLYQLEKNENLPLEHHRPPVLHDVPTEPPTPR